MPKRDPRNYSTAEALAQFALELDAQRSARAESGPFAEGPVPVFSPETRDRIVIEAARVLVADGLDIRGE